MASLSTIATASIRDRDASNVVPAFVVEQRRKQRAELQKRAGSTLIGQALSEEAAS
jgi:hypothetical protein